jgi:hypothetical protein
VLDSLDLADGIRLAVVARDDGLVRLLTEVLVPELVAARAWQAAAA